MNATYMNNPAESAGMLRETFAPAAIPDRYSGVHALWTKVIIRAIFDWVSYRESSKLPLKKVADQAHQWLFLPNNLFNSFENICRYLNLDPDTIREKAKKLTKDDIAKAEHVDRGPYEFQRGEMLLDEVLDEPEDV